LEIASMAFGRVIAAVASLVPLRISALIVPHLAAALASGGVILLADEIKAQGLHTLFDFAKANLGHPNSLQKGQ
jgi:hypothetical protein